MRVSHKMSKNCLSILSKLNNSSRPEITPPILPTAAVIITSTSSPTKSHSFRYPFLISFKTTMKSKGFSTSLKNSFKSALTQIGSPFSSKIPHLTDTLRLSSISIDLESWWGCSTLCKSKPTLSRTGPRSSTLSLNCTAYWLLSATGDCSKASLR